VILDLDTRAARLGSGAIASNLRVSAASRSAKASSAAGKNSRNTAQPQHMRGAGRADGRAAGQRVALRMLGPLELDVAGTTSGPRGLGGAKPKQLLEILLLGATRSSRRTVSPMRCGQTGSPGELTRPRVAVRG